MESVANSHSENRQSIGNISLGAEYFANSAAVLNVSPFHGRSVWDIVMYNAIICHDDRHDRLTIKRKYLLSLSSAARKLASPVLSFQKERLCKERRHFLALIVNAVNRFWSNVQSHVDATEEVQLQDQRKKELHEKQISSLEYTEKLLKSRVKFQLGKGEIPPLRLLEQIGSGLRGYQKIGVEWLISLHDQGISGILADEMGLGKTVQTIAFFSYLAEHRCDWGTHLIVVPMSILLNWENEFHRWAPAFNVLAYYGSVKERSEKRKGWDSNVHYNAVIVSYNTLLKDKRIFRRRKWHYLVLDEAHAIKSWETQRWQVLLDFSTQHRLLLSGTPLQNNPLELWSLLHFLMPESIVFESYEDFKELYGNPVASLDVVHRLHQTLRPFVLRRLKCDVEKQLPKKVEKILLCPLSKRQRTLYDEYMALEETRNILASKDTLSILGVLMALRKVCNHPDLFQERRIESPFVMQSSVASKYLNSIPKSLIFRTQKSPIATWCSSGDIRHSEFGLEILRDHTLKKLTVRQMKKSPTFSKARRDFGAWPCLEEYAQQLREYDEAESENRICNATERHRRALIDALSWSCLPIFRLGHVPQAPLTKSASLMKNHSKELQVPLPNTTVKCLALNRQNYFPEYTFSRVQLAPDELQREFTQFRLQKSITHPHRRMLQYDSGKLQVLSQLLPQLHREEHKCLIFTQFTKVLNILEKFLTTSALTYFRLDGSTPVKKRQMFVDEFNSNSRIFAFILSTRSGGLGLNLVGADTVIFYDSDWNPAIDVQAQDRCHRIGQVRDVTIYRLVSEFTVEEKILFRAREKKRMNNIVMRAGGFDNLSADRASIEPDSQWKDSVLDFFHNFDEDYNDGQGEKSRCHQLENCLQKIEEDEDFLFDQENRLDEAEKNEAILHYGIDLQRAISNTLLDNISQKGSFSVTEGVLSPTGEVPSSSDFPTISNFHRLFYLRSQMKYLKSRLYALCLRHGVVIRIVCMNDQGDVRWLIEFQKGIAFRELSASMLRQNFMENTQELTTAPLKKRHFETSNSFKDPKAEVESVRKRSRW